MQINSGIYSVDFYKLCCIFVVMIKYETAIGLIEPHLPQFSAVCTAALEDLQAQLATFPGSMYNRTKATVMHNLICERLKTELGSTDGVRVFEEYESVSIVMDNKVLLRFKKLKKDGLPSNIRTRRSSDWDAQLLQMKLFPEYPDMACIDWGYVVDSTWSEIKSLKVMCRINANIQWEYLVRTSTLQVATSLPFPEQTETQPFVITAKKEKRNTKTG